MKMLKVFNEISMIFATFKNRKHFCDLPAQHFQKNMVAAQTQFGA